MYITEIEKILESISKKPIMVFATSKNQKVTARNMSVIVLGNRIYFQTGLSMTKSQQIIENENVAFCIDNYQIYGKAKNIGTWEQHEDVLKEYRKVHNSSYETYKNVKDEIVVETTIHEIEMWEYREGKPFIVQIDLDKNEYKIFEYQVN